MGPLLLGSGGIRTPERVATWHRVMHAVLGERSRVLFIPHALADHDGYVRMLIERGLDGGYSIDGLHRHADPLAAIQNAEAIFVGGGNTFRLLTALYRMNLLDAIRSRVQNGMPYLGVSAGTNVACPTICTTNDMPIVEPPSLNALGLVPFQINPHYFLGSTFVRHGDGFVEHFGETRDDRIREYHEENSRPVIGLREGSYLVIRGGQIELVGAPARLFLPQQEPIECQPGDSLSSWISIS